MSKAWTLTIWHEHDRSRRQIEAFLWRSYGDDSARKLESDQCSDLSRSFSVSNWAGGKTIQTLQSSPLAQSDFSLNLDPHSFPTKTTCLSSVQDRLMCLTKPNISLPARSDTMPWIRLEYMPADGLQRWHARLCGSGRFGRLRPSSSMNIVRGILFDTG